MLCFKEYMWLSLDITGVGSLFFLFGVTAGLLACSVSLNNAEEASLDFSYDFELVMYIFLNLSRRPVE